MFLSKLSDLQTYFNQQVIIFLPQGEHIGVNRFGTACMVAEMCTAILSTNFQPIEGRLLTHQATITVFNVLTTPG